MNGSVEYTNNRLKLIIKSDGSYDQELQAAYYQKEEDYFVKTFEGEFAKAEKLKENFPKLIPGMFERTGDWKEAILYFAKKCKENGIVWFLTGSACDAVRGLNVVPHDLDIEIYSRHWKKAEEVFEDYMVEPFIETKGWVRQYFGRLAISDIQIDVVADAKYDFPEHEYEPYEWNGYTIWLEPFMTRYKTEISRERQDRIQAFKDFLEQRGIQQL